MERAKPGLDPMVMALAMAIGGEELPTGVSDPPAADTDTGLVRTTVLMPDGSALPAGSSRCRT